MLSDCDECANKNTEECNTCHETSGNRPSKFKPKEENKESSGKANE